MINSSVENINKLESWVMASRPKTLLAAFVPVLVGSAIAYNDGMFQPAASTVALLCAVLIQIGTNWVNDLFDFLSGKDTDQRVGPTRVLASGLISVKEMKVGIILIFTLTFVIGLYLVYTAGWVLLLIGILSIIAGIGYTAGPYPLAYNGLGDIFVFIFFGLIGTVGTYYVQSLQVTGFVLWASIPVGALITNILVINNFRDIEEDRTSGKQTLAVKLGRRFTQIQYLIFMILSYLVLVVVFFTFKQSVFVFLPILTLPLSIKLIKMIYTLQGEALNKTLELTAKLSAIYGVLFAIGILI
ncbi:MAG: 1,4-dihydroxy-2-naphthoate polyprenyltransferase [Bacteroidetes bacterium]|nr:1,4-dihydroxy-2-naphthoate polyprenyltransferase [Bacteroidota bacterium]